MDHHHTPPTHHAHTPACHEDTHDQHGQHSTIDLMLWGSLATLTVLYAAHLLAADRLTEISWLADLANAAYALINTVWWGVAIGICMVALLGKIPREFVIAILGSGTGPIGIIRATLGGVLLDLCSHGILMVGARLYERGASAGQVIAFLVASPWNSFSLTLVLIALMGFGWTMAFIGLSLVVAILAGLAFEFFVARGTLPANPNRFVVDADFRFWPEARARVSAATFDGAFFKSMALDGLRGARPVLRWILFGVLLAALVQAFVATETMETWFGPSLIGLSLTLGVATIMEVCSEGSAPIAADLLGRAGAPGNAFAFLMAGVATDYTEIMILRETTRSWRFALFLPLVTLPQVVLLGWLLNTLAQ